MSQVIITNSKPTSTNDGFYAFWLLTRALLAAGWKYKGSGDATATGTKDTSGNFLSDKWGVGGGVVLNSTVQSGTASDTMTANTDGTVTHVITGATFTANSVGRFLTITGATNSANNGTFRIVTFTSATTVKVWNPASTTETTTITYAEKQGGADGTISSAGSGGATPGRAIFSISTGAFVAPTTSPPTRGSVGDRITIAGGAIGANNGTFMITRVISSTSVEIDNSAASSVGETSNGSLIWTECSPTTQTYPASLNGTGVGAWANLQGPSTLKIPIGTNAPTGTFLRGELVTQTASGATGTILGVLTDTTGGLGYLVVEPRLNGTGSGVRGWTSGSTDTVSAASAPTGSGASVTSSATAPIEYVREMVLWRASNTTGHFWFQTVDQSAESASRYSVLATGAGVTNTIAPGGATGTFPTAGSWAVFGTGGSNAATTGAIGWHCWSGTFYGAVHICAATCIENSTESADGSWTILQGVPNYSSSSYVPTAFMHMDGSEEGDVDPYITYTNTGGSAYSGSRTSFTNTNTGSPPAMCGFSQCYTGTTQGRGWRRRGFSTGDAFQEFSLGWVTGNGIGAAPLNTNNSYPGHVANHPTPAIYQVKEALWVVSYNLNQKMRKGYFRWWFMTDGGFCHKLLDNGRYIQIYESIGNSAGGPFVVGPWDGVTQPLSGF